MSLKITIPRQGQGHNVVDTNNVCEVFDLRHKHIKFEH